MESESIIYFLFFIIFIILLAITGKMFLLPLIAAMKIGSYFSKDTGSSVDKSTIDPDNIFDDSDFIEATEDSNVGAEATSDSYVAGAEADDNIFQGSNDYAESRCGGLDALYNFLNNSNLNATMSEIAASHAASKLDAKLLTAAKLKTMSAKQLTFETFVDKLAANSMIYLYSLDKKPTDIAVAELSKNKNLLASAADIIDRKFPDCRVKSADLRELARKITDKTREVAQMPFTASEQASNRLIKLGNISREDLIAKYILLLTDVAAEVPYSSSYSSNTSLDECRRDLSTCNSVRSRLTMDNESLRITNEALRLEIARGLTDYTCRNLLRDCNAEKERLQREIANLQLGDNQETPRLRNEVQELKSIIGALNAELTNKENNLQSSSKYQDQIKKLEDDLKDCWDTNAAVESLLHEKL